jgi:hypothetical protein
MSTVLVESAAPEVRWSAAVRVAFRLCFVYFGLYILTTQMLGGLLIVPNWGFLPLEQLPPMKNIVTWTAVHVFHITRPLVISGSGSGDKTFNWIAAFCLLVFSIAATTIWSVLDRKRGAYVDAHKWFRLFLRFAVGSTMLSYGIVKVFPLQMPYPPLTRLLEPFGNFSPMGVLWYSVGASPSYERFAGSMELAAAVLLFVPRLSLLGAMVCFADAVQIFTLNMTYDVPVKLFAFHLILMALVLIAPDARRVLTALVLDRAAPPSDHPSLVRSLRGRRILFWAQIAFATYLIGMSAVGAYRSWTRSGGGAPKPPLYGIWNVDRMWIEGVERSPLITDDARWRRVIVQALTGISFQRMDDTITAYVAKIDMNARTIALTRVATPPGTPGVQLSGAHQPDVGRFVFQRPDNEHLSLEGVVDGRKIRMQLTLFDRKRFLLVSRGFNWIQEYPFNR